jgi:hypothetical protein
LWSINVHNFWTRTLAFRSIDRTKRARRCYLTTWAVIASNPPAQMGRIGTVGIRSVRARLGKDGRSNEKQ